MKSSYWLPVAVLTGWLAGCTTDQPVTYNKPLTSPGGKFTTLSPVVQNAVRAQVGSADIADIWKSTNFGPTVYEIRFQNSALFPPLYVASDGSVLTSNLDVAVGASEDTFVAATGGASSGLKLGDLPPSVVKTIHRKAPTAEVGHITRIVEGDKVFYEVSFKDEGQTPKMLIADDGTLIGKVPPQ